MIKIDKALGFSNFAELDHPEEVRFIHSDPIEACLPHFTYAAIDVSKYDSWWAENHRHSYIPEDLDEILTYSDLADPSLQHRKSISKTRKLIDAYNSNMKIDLQSGISRNNALQDIHLQLNSCEIPHSFYNFSSNLNNINLNVDNSPSLVLTEQHYDIYELVAFITASSFPYSATFDSQKNKITLTNTDATSHTINFSQTDSQKLATALGFNQTDRVVGSGSTLTSDNSVNLNTIHSIFVHTNLTVSNVITTTEGNLRNIIQKIPVKSMFSEIINYNPTENAIFSSVTNINEIKSLEISLRDQNDILIDFNNVNFEISLLFEIHNTQPQITQPPENL